MGRITLLLYLPGSIPKRVDAGSFGLRPLAVVQLGKGALTDRESRWKNWMLEAQAGNEKSYESLLRELAEAAGSYVGKRISDEASAADFSQDVLLAVHRARHTFQGSRMFSPWFFAIVKNRFIDMIRATRRRPVEFASEEAVGLMIARDPDWVARDAIQEAIARLPDVQQKVIRLQMHGSSIQEMAAELDLGISATKVRAHRARKALEKLLRQDYEFD